MKHYLLLDMGTGNSRVALADSNGNILGIKSYSNTYYRDDLYEDAQYFYPNEWKNNLLSGCMELCKEFPEIKIDGISAAAARQSFVLIDKDGNSFLGLPNIDNRGREFVSSIEDKTDIYKRTGKWVTEDFGAAKILGLKKKYPDLYHKIYKLTSLSEWLAYVFTDEIVMEYSHASETQLYDLKGKKWALDICEKYDIDSKILPSLCRSGTVLSSINPSIKNDMNFSENTVFIIGGADTQMGTRQADVRVGDIVIVSGTTSPVITLMKDYFYDKEERVWIDADLCGNSYQIEMNPGVTGMNYQKMKYQFCSGFSYDELEKEYEKKTTVHCTASFTSLLFYKKKSLKRGGFFMKSPFQDPITVIDLMYSVLADIACSIYEELRRLIDITGNDPEYILACGGGFQSQTLCKMVASLIKKPLKLKNGYSQATIQGLIQICNKVFKEIRHENLHDFIVTVEKDHLILDYYPLWLTNRNQVNGCE